MACNKFARATANSIAEYEGEAIRAINNKLMGNGYSPKWLDTARKRKRKNRNNCSTQRPLVMKLPYVNECINGLTRTALRRNGIDARLVNPRPMTVRELAKRKSDRSGCSVRNCPVNNSRQCTKTFTVFLATCNLCSAEYIGSTSRELHYRAKEHR